MAKPMRQDELQAIEDAVRRYPDGASLEQIEQGLKTDMPRRTLQHRLKHLVSKDRLAMSGERRWARYRIKVPGEEKVFGRRARIEEQGSLFVPVSSRGAAIQEYVRKPETARKPAGYDRPFLDGYRPNETAYLSASERAHLRKIGTPQTGEQPAGGEIAGTDARGAFEIRRRVVKLLRLPSQVTELQVRLEVVDIQIELTPELALGRVLTAGPEQRPPVHRMHGWQLGIQFDRPLELRQR